MISLLYHIELIFIIMVFASFQFNAGVFSFYGLCTGTNLHTLYYSRHTPQVLGVSHNLDVIPTVFETIT